MTMKAKINMLFILMVLSLLTGCQSQKQVGSNGSVFRTHYESLQLNTAEESIQTFVRAFQQCDFITVYMILAPATQQEIYKSQNYLSIGDFISENLSAKERKAFEQRVNDRLPLENPEHFLDTLHYFDIMMLTAAQHSFLPFNFPGEIIILDSHGLKITSDQETLDVPVEIEGVDGQLVFRLVRSPSQKWRVFQVVWPDGDKENIPWALPPIPMKKAPFPCQTNGGVPRTTYGQLDLQTPEMTVQALAQAFQEKDFPTVYWILDQSTQREWLTNLALMRFEKLVNTKDPRFIWQTEWAKKILSLEESGLINHSEEFSILIGSIGSSLGDKESPYHPLVMEQIGNSSYLFDQIMLAASAQYLIDLNRSITILETKIKTSKEGEDTAIVTAVFNESKSKVTFHLRQSLSGRWRVLQVILLGGDESIFPWAAPTDGQ